MDKLRWKFTNLVGAGVFGDGLGAFRKGVLIYMAAGPRGE